MTTLDKNMFFNREDRSLMNLTLQKHLKKTETRKLQPQTTNPNTAHLTLEDEGAEGPSFRTLEAYLTDLKGPLWETAKPGHSSCQLRLTV